MAINPPCVILMHSRVCVCVCVYVFADVAFVSSYNSAVILSYLSTSFNILRFENLSLLISGNS